MQNLRWYNPHLPQTLVIAQLLLYFNAAFGLFDLLTGRISLSASITHFAGIVIIGGIALGVFGAQGIANEKKLGYLAAVASSLAPIAARVIYTVQFPQFFGLSFVLFSNSVLNVLFEYALIALLLHPMSRNHQKVWFG